MILQSWKSNRLHCYTARVSRERILSQKIRNFAKIFLRISKTFSRNFLLAKINFVKGSENDAELREKQKYAKKIAIFAKFMHFLFAFAKFILSRNTSTQNFNIFSYERKAKKCKFFCEKCEIFAKRFSYFPGNPKHSVFLNLVKIGERGVLLVFWAWKALIGLVLYKGCERSTQ